MKVSILIPCFNERASIEELLRRVRTLPLEKEIIVIDDGSTDGTGELLRSISREGERVLSHKLNRGKGSAIRTGLAHATGDVIVIQDADLEYDPHDIKRMLEVLERTESPVVYGSRVLSRAAHSSTTFYLGGRLLSMLTNILYGSSITDEPTCYKMFRREVLEGIRLECRGFEFCPEVTAKVLRLGYPITEIPISYTPRSWREGKKISAWDGAEAIWYLLKYRFQPKHHFHTSIEKPMH